MECVLSIVDDGASLVALATTTGGGVVGRAQSDGPANPRHIGTHSFRRRLERVVAEASTGLGDAICLAVTAALTADPDAVRDFLAEVVPLDRERVRVAPYEQCALAGAVGTVGPERAIVIRADVMSRGWGVGTGGREASCGGFGAVFGDEGSAYQIGVLGIQAALRALERRARNTVPKSLLLSHYGIASYHELLRPEHEEPALDRYQIAGFAPAVFEGGQRDDQVALDILEQAGRDLATMALALVNELDLIDQSFQVLPTGRVIELRGALMETFIRTLKTKTAKANLIREGMGAAAGGALLAVEHLGLKVRPEIAETLRSSLQARA